MQGRDFDARYGVETEDKVEVADLGDFPGRETSLRYYPLPIELFPEIVSKIPSALDNLVFIDIGAGKGRVVFLASDYPFKEIVGIEFSPLLCDAMKGNLSKYNNPDQKCVVLRAELADARYFEFPDQDCVLFFANPMEQSALEEVLDNIKGWLNKYARKCTILYVYPQKPAHLVKAISQHVEAFDITHYDLSVWHLITCVSK